MIYSCEVNAVPRAVLVILSIISSKLASKVQTVPIINNEVAKPQSIHDPAAMQIRAIRPYIPRTGLAGSMVMERCFLPE